jgi:hypothetical protein
MHEMCKNEHNILVSKIHWKPKREWKNTIKMDLHKLDIKRTELAKYWFYTEDDGLQVPLQEN